MVSAVLNSVHLLEQLEHTAFTLNFWIEYKKTALSKILDTKLCTYVKTIGTYECKVRVRLGDNYVLKPCH